MSEAGRPRRGVAPDRWLRVWQVVERIAATPGQTRKEMAHHFYVSERQIQADLDLIRNVMGLPLVRERGYRFLDAHGNGSAPGMTLPDLLALATVLDAHQDAATRQAARALTGCVALHLRPLAQELLNEARRDLFLPLARAILDDRRPVRVTVQRRHDHQHVTLRPALLVLTIRGWTLIGSGLAETAFRAVPLQRVTEVVVWPHLEAAS